MQTHFPALLLVLSLVAAACGDASAPEVAAKETLGVTEEALTYRYCSGPQDCDDSWEGTSNQCVPDGFSPPNPDCGVPPERACTTAANCQQGCVCEGGFCEQDGFGPANPYCYLPPPDAYEDDNTAAHASAYLGSPQTGHTFDQLGDEDWVGVYFGGAGQYNFETYNLIGADTKLAVYKSSNGTVGQLVAVNDNVCNISYNAQCKASKVTLNVPANSLYFVRILNQDPYTNYQHAPSYDLRIY